MHPANKENLEYLRAWLSMLQKEGKIDSFSEITEHVQHYNFKIKPKFSLRPIWHISLNIEEEV